MHVLDVQQLKVWDRHTGKGIVHGSSFHVKQGSCLAIAGESGSGKSVTCRAILRLNKRWMEQSGDIRLRGESLTSLSEPQMRKKRGKQLYMIMQHGMRAFDPTSVIGVHIRETLAWHLGWNRTDITARMCTAMKSVRLSDPVKLMNQYPHQLSGGMLQRVMIALALVLEPELILADEPTTALDTIAQCEVVEQLTLLRERIDCSMILVAHDLGLVRTMAEDMLVMKDGHIVEYGTVKELFADAKHAYTRYLTAANRSLHTHFQAVMRGTESC